MRGKDFPISIRFLYPRVSHCRVTVARDAILKFRAYSIEVFTGQEFLSWKSRYTKRGTATLGGCRWVVNTNAVLFTLICHQTAIYLLVLS